MHVAGGGQGSAVIQLDWPPHAGTIAVMLPGLIRLIPGARHPKPRARHPQRREQALSHQGLPTLARQLLRHGRRNQVAGVGIAELADGAARRVGQILSKDSVAPGNHGQCRMRRPPGRHVVRNAAYVANQLPQGDGAVVWMYLVNQLGKDLGNRRLPAVDKCSIRHQGRQHGGRHRLGDGAYLHQIVDRQLLG